MAIVGKTQKKFTIVEFEDSAVEVVPSGWISADKLTCKFPNPIPKGFSKTQKDENIQPGLDWENYNIRCVDSSGKSS